MYSTGAAKISFSTNQVLSSNLHLYQWYIPLHSSSLLLPSVAWFLQWEKCSIEDLRVNVAALARDVVNFTLSPPYFLIILDMDLISV